MPEPALVKSRIRNPFAGLGGGKIVCGYSSRGFGNMSVRYGPIEGALENRRGFLEELGVDCRDLICAQQVHGSAVEYVAEADRGRGAAAYDSAVSATDGLITDKRNVPLAIFTADCLCVFLYDPNAPAVGLLHAGWRSARADIAGRAVRQMQERFGTDPSRLYAAFGPAIRDCCYEVSAEFNDYFPYAVLERGRSLYLDLALISRNQLIASGVKKANIFDSGACTFCGGSNFFSYRREGEACGRMMSVAMLL